VTAAIGEPDITYEWRGEITDDDMVDLVRSHGGAPCPGWWDQVRPHSLGWVTARRADGLLVAFVNVAWDGSEHAFLLDTKTRDHHQRRGIATEVVRRAVEHAARAGCTWLHVDFEARLAPFYFDACGFRPTDGGLIHLPELR
jgi:GNAT superfamily N-acetyltransferase